MRLLIIFTYLISLGVFAEVSDKIASIPQMWLQGFLFGGIGFLLSTKKWWLSLIGFILVFAMASGTYDMQTDKFMSAAVINEQGEGYFITGYISSAVAALLTASGVFYGIWRKSKKNT
jgi:hypothetical protein